MKKKDKTNVGEGLCKHSSTCLELEYKLVAFSEVKLGNMLEMPEMCRFQSSNPTLAVNRIGPMP